MNDAYKPLGLAYGGFLALAGVFLMILALVHGTFLNSRVAAVLAFLPYVAAVASGALLGYVARERRLFQLAILGCLMAVTFGILNMAHEVLIGPVPVPGPSGFGVVALVTLPLAILFSLLGGGLGAGLRRFTHG